MLMTCPWWPDVNVTVFLVALSVLCAMTNNIYLTLADVDNVKHVYAGSTGAKFVQSSFFLLLYILVTLWCFIRVCCNMAVAILPMCKNVNSFMDMNCRKTIRQVLHQILQTSLYVDCDICMFVYYVTFCFLCNV